MRTLTKEEVKQLLELLPNYKIIESQGNNFIGIHISHNKKTIMVRKK